MAAAARTSSNQALKPGVAVFLGLGGVAPVAQDDDGLAFAVRALVEAGESILISAAGKGGQVPQRVALAHPGRVGRDAGVVQHLPGRDAVFGVFGWFSEHGGLLPMFAGGVRQETGRLLPNNVTQRPTRGRDGVRDWAKRLHRLWEDRHSTAERTSADVSQWGPLTARTHRAATQAQQEAARQGFRFVEPHHLLLGLLHEPDTLAGRTLQHLGVDPAALRRELERSSASGDPAKPPRLSSAGKNALTLAGVQARRGRCKFLGTEHLLLGLIQEAAAARRDGDIWARHGITLHRAQTAIGALSGASDGVWPPPPRPQGYAPDADGQA